jgi:hypothetical protein
VIRAARALGQLLASVLLIVGLPAVVVLALRRWGPPWPSAADVLEGGSAGPAGILLVVAVPVVLVWLAFSVHLLRLGVRQARAHLRMPRPSQLTAGALVLSSSAVVMVAAPAAAAPAEDVAAQGVDLPDGAGWVPAAVGQAVATTAAAVWLRRRRGYRPHTPGDAELQPLPVTVNAITAVTGTREPALVDPGSLPPGGIVLAGSGARDALRGLLITLLLAHRPVVMSWADLGELLDDPYLSAPVPAGLRAVDDLEEIGVGEVALTLHPPASTGTWVCAGPGDAGTRWEVGGDGTVSRTRRLCVLNTRAAADLFTLLTLARRDEPAELAPASAVARLRLLGGCELSVDGRPVAVRRSAGLQVLAYLGLHPDGATGHELIAAIWPGLRPAAITGRLHVTVSELRKELRSGTPVELLRHAQGRYRLTAATDVDVRPLRTAVAALERALTAGERRQAQRAIVDAYPGELTAGCDWPWVMTWRERFRRQVLAAYLDLADAAEPAEALRLLRAAMTVDPHNEDIRARAQEAAAAL